MNIRTDKDKKKAEALVQSYHHTMESLQKAHDEEDASSLEKKSLKEAIQVLERKIEPYSSALKRYRELGHRRYHNSNSLLDIGEVLIRAREQSGLTLRGLEEKWREVDRKYAKSYNTIQEYEKKGYRNASLEVISSLSKVLRVSTSAFFWSPGYTPTIIIVDDQIDFAEAWRDELQEDWPSWTILCAASPEEYAELLDDHFPTFVISDNFMDRFCGKEIVETTIERCGHFPTVVLVSGDWAQDKSILRNSPGVPCFTKSEEDFGNVKKIIKARSSELQIPT